MSTTTQMDRGAMLGLRLTKTLLTTICLGLSVGVHATAQDAAFVEELCPSQNAVIYFLPGESQLDSFDEAVVDLFAQRSYGCMIDQMEVDAFADDADGLDDWREMSAARATTVLGALSIRGVAANAVSVRLHDLLSQNTSSGANIGRRCVVRISLRPHSGPMS